MSSGQLKSGKSVNHRKEIYGVFYLAAAIFLAVVFYAPIRLTGWIGNLFRNFGLGLLGTMAFAIPVLLIIMAIDYFIEDEIKVTKTRLTCVILLMLFLSVLISLITLGTDELAALSRNDAGKPTAWRALGQLWSIGKDPSLSGASGWLTWSGGLIGGLVSQALQVLAGRTGAFIIIGAMILAILALIFNVSYSRTVRRTAKAVKQTTDHVSTAVRQQFDRMQEAREERLTQKKDAAAYDHVIVDADETAGAATDPVPDADAAEAQPTVEVGGAPDATDTSPDLSASAEAAVHYRLPPGDWRAAESEAAGAAAGVYPVFPTVETSLPERGAGVPPASSVRTPQIDVDQPVVGSAGATPQTDGLTTIEPDRLDQQMRLPELADLYPKAGGPLPDADQSIPEGDSDLLTAVDSRDQWDDRRTGKSDVSLNLPRGKDRQIRLQASYTPPPLKLLREDVAFLQQQRDVAPIQAMGRKLEETLASFGVEATVTNFTTGPTITRFELAPGPGVKVSRITNLENDLALNLAASSIRIEAPIPGKAAIGIEIPNKVSHPVLLRGLLESQEFKSAKSPLTAALGRDIQGNAILCDLARMPHLLVAGATGSGKSVCVNSILISLLYRSSPEEVRLLMIDPKVVELSIYNGIPHLLQPVVTDSKKAFGVLNWAVSEMDRRYELFAGRKVRDITGYNTMIAGDVHAAELKLPLIVLIIDELADLMAVAKNDIESSVARLTAKARAAGIHLIIATQRPSVDVITGVIKANIPSRIAFMVSAQVDSRTILDTGGAEKLLGKGDMLYFPQSSTKPIRGQGAFVTDGEVESVISHIRSLYAENYDDDVAAVIDSTPTPGSRSTNGASTAEAEDGEDELLDEAIRLCIETEYASVSMIQRRLSVGFPRAARLIDRMHELGYIGPHEGSKPRKLLITLDEYLAQQDE